MVAGLSGWSWFGLVVYLVVMAFVIHPVRVPLGRPLSSAVRSTGSALRLIDSPARDTPPISVPLDLRTAPVAGVILLLITTAIPGSVLRAGIVGTETVQPYDVLVLFISLAYISTALDSTGGLRSLAFWISQKSGNRPATTATTATIQPEDGDSPTPSPAISQHATASGRKLWSILYWFWFLAGVVVGNDPIILSGTPFLCYFAEHVELSTSTAWTFAQFISANVASAALVSSNPTNILIANAFKLNYITHYTAYTILPCFIAALVGFALCFFVYTVAKPTSNAPDLPTGERAAFIPKQLTLPEVNPRNALLDPPGAIFHSSLMAVTLAVLIGTTFVPHEAVEVWMVTAPAGVIAFVHDLATEWYRGREAAVRGEKVREGEVGQSSIEMSERKEVGAEPAVPRPFVVQRASIPALKSAFRGRFPTTTGTIERLPLSLLLFAGGIFVLVRALTYLGWTPIFAEWLVRIARNPASVTFLLGYIIALLCPVCGTNIGATILFVEILTDPAFLNSPQVVADPRILTAAIYSTALGSNLGACGWSLSGSLAGLLWSSILKQKGTTVRATTFAKWNVWILPSLSTVASAVIVLEVYYWPGAGTVAAGMSAA